MINSLFAQSSFDPVNKAMDRQNLISALKENPTTALMQDECIAGFCALHEYVIKDAYKNNNFITGICLSVGPLSTDTRIDERKYETEIEILVNLSRALSYSYALMQTMDKGRKKLVSHVRKTGYLKLNFNWENMSVLEKKNQVEDFIKQQIIIYSRVMRHPLAIPRIEILKENVGYEASCKSPRPIERFTTIEDASLEFRKAFIQNARVSDVLSVAYHETIHHMMLQLALAIRDKVLDSRHPLYDDASLKLAQLKHGKDVSYKLEPVYYSDSEECLARFEEAEFIFEIENSPLSWQRFRRRAAEELDFLKAMCVGFD